MEIGIITTLIAIVLFVWVIRWLKAPFKFWLDRGVSGPTPIWILGNLHQLFSKMSSEVQFKWYKKYGRIFGYYEGTEPVLVIGEPKLVHQICVKDASVFSSRVGFPIGHSVFDDNIGFTTDKRIWKRQRDIVVSMFNMGRMKKTMWPRLHASITTAIDDIEEKLGQCNTARFDIAEFFFPVFMRHIGSCAFHWDAYAEGPEFIRVLGELFSKDKFGGILFALNLKDTPEFSIKAAEYLESYLKDLIYRRRTDPRKGQYNDYLDLMLGYKNDISASLAHKVSELSEKEIIGEVISTLESFKATYTTFCFVMCHLAAHPEIQETVYTEVIANCDDREDEYEKLKNLKYLDAVMAESARLSPITAYHYRAPNQDYKLGSIHIPAHTRVQLPIYSMHRDEKLFPEPNAFKPERFMEDSVIPCSYLPMGVGAMQCGGMRFGQLQIKATLVHLLRRFNFFNVTEPELCPRHEFTILPKEILCTVKRRV